MMRLPFTALVVLAALAAGCAPAFDVTGRDWAKPGASVPQVTLDETQCARQGHRTGGTPDLLLGGILDLWRLGVEYGGQVADYTGCMTDRGYKPDGSG
jgi:hypothetical protein